MWMSEPLFAPYQALNCTSSTSSRLLPITGLARAQQDGFQPPLPQTLIYPCAKPPRVLACLSHAFVPGASAREPERLSAGHRCQNVAGEVLSLPCSHGASSSRKKMPWQRKGCWDYSGGGSQSFKAGGRGRRGRRPSSRAAQALQLAMLVFTFSNSSRFLPPSGLNALLMVSPSL